MDRNLVVNKALLYQTLPTKELYDKFDAVEEKCLAEAKSKGIKENYKTIYELEKCLYRRQNPEMFLLHLIKMNAAYKLLILAFMVYSAEALLKRKEYGPVFTKVADECHDICIDVTGASDENIKQVGMGHFVDDEKVQRYILCLWRVSRVMDKNLVVNKALLDSILPKKELKDGFDAIEETCLAAAKNKGFKENYETIYDLEKCLYSKQPHEDFIMP